MVDIRESSLTGKFILERNNSRSTPGSVLGLLFFLTCINDLCDDLSCDVKHSADDTSLFTMVFNENISAQNLNSDLRKIQEWAFLWKMQFTQIL